MDQRYRDAHEEPDRARSEFWENFVRIITFAILAALCFSNVGMALNFWQSFVSADAFGKGLLEITGGSLAFLEPTMLALADDADRHGQHRQARQWRLVFIAVIAVNLTADFAAIAAVTGGDTGARTQAQIVYDQHVVERTHVNTEIERLEQAMPTELRLPRTSLAPLLAERQQQADVFTARGETAPFAVRHRIAELESAIATRETIDTLERTRAGDDAYFAQHQGRPEGAHAQFVSVNNLLGIVGVAPGTDNVRIMLAFAMILVVKFALCVGWALVLNNQSDDQSQRITSRWFSWRWWPFKAPATMLDDFRRRYGWGAPRVSDPASPAPPPPAAPLPRPRAPKPRFGKDVRRDFDGFGSRE